MLHFLPRKLNVIPIFIPPSIFLLAGMGGVLKTKCIVTHLMCMSKSAHKEKLLYFAAPASVHFLLTVWLISEWQCCSQRKQFPCHRLDFLWTWIGRWIYWGGVKLWPISSASNPLYHFIWRVALFSVSLYLCDFLCSYLFL